MTHSSLIIKKEDNNTSRAIRLLAAGIGVSERQVEVGAWLILADAISFLLATLVTSAITVVVLPPSDLSALTPFDALGLLLFLASCLAVGLYKGAGPSPFERLRLRVFAIILFVAEMLFLYALLGSIASQLQAAVILGILLLPAGFYLEVLVRRALIAKGTWGAPTLVAGTDNKARSIFKHLEAQPELGLRPVGHLTGVNRVLVQTTGSGLGKPVDARVLGLARSVETILLTHPDQHQMLSSFKGPDMAGCRTFVAYDVATLPSLWLQTRSLGSYVGIEMPAKLQLRRNRWLKRAMDIALAGPMLLLALPVMGAMMIAIKIIDPGPTIYMQKRTGQGGCPILVFKIRTMYVDAEVRLQEYLDANPAAREEWQRECKLRNDPRVLPRIGSFIRSSSLDELPQLWNVLRGDMSIVGPRPLPFYDLERFDADFKRERQLFPPGLTGLWQVSSRNGDLEFQRAEDLFYIQNWSMWLDFYILLKTPLAVLSRKGAY